MAAVKKTIKKPAKKISPVKKKAPPKKNATKAAVKTPVKKPAVKIVTKTPNARAVKKIKAAASPVKSKKKVYTIDGKNFTSIYGFFDEITRVMFPDTEWGENLDAFNDVLRGGFGTPEKGFVLEWKNSRLSKKNLGYDHLVWDIEEYLKDLKNPEYFTWLTEEEREENRVLARKDLKKARRGEGQTPFEVLIEIIQGHGPGGEEEQSGVDLVLA